MHSAARRLFVALDFPDAASALAMAERLAPLGVGFKVGLELFTAEGPDLLRRLANTAPASPIFLDLKFHDIPATVAGAVRSASRLGASLMNLHLTGGEAMVRAALAARDEAMASAASPEKSKAEDSSARRDEADGRPRLIGVTVLTSLDGEDLRRVWGDTAGGDASAHALRLARLAREWGLDGVVASAQEAAAIRTACGPEFLIVTPGIRPAGAAAGDQKRTLTPAAAMAAGASHLVVGRPVTQAANPNHACRELLLEIRN